MSGHSEQKIQTLCLLELVCLHAFTYVLEFGIHSLQGGGQDIHCPFPLLSIADAIGEAINLALPYQNAIGLPQAL